MSQSIIITGACGRMGKSLIAQLSQSKNQKLSGATESPSSPFIGQDAGLCAGVSSLDIAITASLGAITNNHKKSVIIDFTHVKATLAHVAFAQKNKIPIVIGTTGFTPAELAIIKSASKKIPVVMAPNMSVGVNALFKLVSIAAQILGEGYDIELFEAHHKLKKDAPSGTAVKLAEILAKATGLNYPKDFNFHRQGMVGERKSKEIGMQVLRGGDIVGEHTVHFCGIGERLELKHIATSRNTFADGALRAAQWLINKKPGLYNMGDVLGHGEPVEP